MNKEHYGIIGKSNIELKHFDQKKPEAQEILIDDKYLENEKKIDDFETNSLDDFKRSDYNCIKQCYLDLFKKDEIQQNRTRMIPFSGASNKSTEGYDMENLVKNQKYNIITFVPLVLFEQFKYFYNLFYLIITLSQFIPLFQVGFLFSYLAPLVFVLTLTMIKEGYDDVQRYLRDWEANSQIYGKLTSRGFVDTRSLKLRVGDIIKVQANQRVPADIIALQSNGTLFIRTDQLDGETDWKLRYPLKCTQSIQEQQLISFGGILIVEQPKLDIYDFKGVLQLNEQSPSEQYKEGIQLSNTLWANTYVATGTVIGIVIYTGRQCRSSMNSREPRSKMGILDKELNFLSKVLCIVMFLAALIVVIAADDSEQNQVIMLFKQVLLLSSIIPISLRVNLDFSKLIFSAKINRDQFMDHAIARNSTIPEELGRVHYIFSDKTGTLTQNHMIFKKLSLENMSITNRNTNYVIKILKKQCAITYPMNDIINRERKGKIIKRSKELVLRDLVTALSLCHNVTPVDDNADGQRTWQASSPDEIALVQMAQNMGILLVSRDYQQITIRTPICQERYQIIAEFPFTSDRKRMGIILKPIDEGADNVMKSKVPEVQRGFLMDECETLSREGLRTLVVTQKFMSEKEYFDWRCVYDQARASLNRRDELIAQSLEQLESQMELLGITGVEDMLQEDIAPTIDTLRNAGIKIWMLTGDKVETAQCIAISTGLKSPQQDMFVIQQVDDLMTLQNLLNQYSLRNGSVLVIDGASLSIALSQCLTQFLQVTSRVPSVICCRCSPTQKALITEAIKLFTKQITLSIGDGGNDVAMIQAADVGVGIIGKEGKQAALASDFSINRFKDLVPLLLWHGRLAYKRSSIMAQFVMHRGLVISVIQLNFGLIFYQMAVPVYNGWLMLGYATIFTTLPVFCLIFDEDVTREKALEFAELYKTLQKGRELTWKTFLIWLWKSIYQGNYEFFYYLFINLMFKGTMIIVLTFMFFQYSFIDLVTVTFTALIIIQLLNVISEVNKITYITIIAQLITASIYLICITTLREQLDVQIITYMFCLKVGALVLVSWLPLHIANYIHRQCEPSETDKIMMKINSRV